MSNYFVTNSNGLKNTNFGLRSMTAAVRYCKICGRNMMDPPGGISGPTVANPAFERDAGFEEKMGIHYLCYVNSQKDLPAEMAPMGDQIEKRIEDIQAVRAELDQAGLEEYAKAFKKPEDSEA